MPAPLKSDVSGGLLAAAASEARTALDNGWVEAQHDAARDAENQRIYAEEQAARAKLAGYNDRENARAAAMRHYIGSCQTCASPIYEEPGYCVECAFFGPEAVETSDAKPPGTQR